MLLGENLPAWPAAAFGAALAGAVSLPVSPNMPGAEIREIGEKAGAAAIFVTRRTAGLATGLDPMLPRVYLDSPAPGGLASWTSVTVSMGGIAKQIPLPRTILPRQNSGAPGNGALPDEEAMRWPDGTAYSHGELLSLAAGSLRLFPRDRIISLCPLAEKGAVILGILAAALGGASISCVETESATEQLKTTALLRFVELLRPTVVIGDEKFLNAAYREKAALVANGPLSRFILTRPLARLLANRRFIKTLGGNIRYYGMGDGPDLPLETAQFLRKIHVPWGSCAASDCAYS
jgi:long-chain acyl-CoA synthetase